MVNKGNYPNMVLFQVLEYGLEYEIQYTLCLFNIAMEAMAHRNRWFTY